MATETYKVGMIVIHPHKPEWGPGKVQAVKGKSLVVYFRDIREDKPGEAQKVINSDYVQFQIDPVQRDPWLDNLPPYQDGQVAPPRIRLTMRQGIEAFLALYPGGFTDPKYLADERNYKQEAHEDCQAALGDGQFEKLLGAGDWDELKKRFFAVEARINILSRFEKAALRDALQDGDAAREFLTALCSMLSAAVEEDTCTHYFRAVTNLPAERSRVATWPVATVLPYLARPDRFMFLKPEVTQGCAARLNFNLCYDARPNWLTYRKLLEMCDLLRPHLEPLGARDMIDLQSFIWVIGGEK